MTDHFIGDCRIRIYCSRALARRLSRWRSHSCVQRRDSSRRLDARAGLDRRSGWLPPVNTPAGLPALHARVRAPQQESLLRG